MERMALLGSKEPPGVAVVTVSPCVCCRGVRRGGQVWGCAPGVGPQGGEAHPADG